MLSRTRAASAAATRFLHNRGVSETKKGIALSFFRRHARCNVVFSPHGNVRLQFGIDLLPYLGSSEKV